MVAPPADPLIGATLGRWQIASVLGEGGMGRVYLAMQPAIGSRVAIKVLSPECSRDRGLVDRFFAEARAVNLIRHESIISVLDLQWLDDGRPYIVMEYVGGATLSALVRQGPLPLGSLARLTAEVLSALAAAHDRGIVHRDLKPDNVIVTVEGHAKVLDFGIAKLAPALRGDSPRTRTGSLLGTPDYMAPEQIAGIGEIDGRTDVYAAGVMLFECATGRRPFAGATLYDLLRAHVEQPAPSARALRPGLPVELEAVIARAMAKRPEDRFPSAAEMSAALAQACAKLPAAEWTPLVARGVDGDAVPTPPHQGTTARPPIQFAPTAVARPRRSWLPLAVIGGVVVAAAIAIVVFAPSSSSSGRAAAAPDAGSRYVAPAPPRPTPPAPKLAFDARNFDALAFLPTAEAAARAFAPDAELITFDVDGVHPDGHADLTLDEDYDATYDFRSPALSKRPADLPIGVEAEIPCLIHVVVSPADGVRGYTGDDAECAQPLRPHPRCSLAEVWKKAIAIGAPATGAVMQIDYLWDGWFVQIGLDTFTESVPDDCP